MFNLGVLFLFVRARPAYLIVSSGSGSFDLSRSIRGSFLTRSVLLSEQRGLAVFFVSLARMLEVG
jgi:hypothetical protein